MVQLMSLPLGRRSLIEYPDLSAACRAVGCDGVEGIWCGEEFPEKVPSSLCIGYHLTFYPDWLDFWREDRRALRRKFGGNTAWREFFGGDCRESLLAYYKADLQRAISLGARYVVFHVSDVSDEEIFTYRWLHSHMEVIDGAVEVLNWLLDGVKGGFWLLVENQWWPGFTFTDPECTARLLDGIRYPDKGIMLDTGHLLNCNTGLRTEEEGVDYIHRMLDLHGRSLSHKIRGIHLHQSLSGAYVRSHAGSLPPAWPEEYGARYAISYRQVLQIDRHQPWHTPEIRSVVERISPDYLVHELAASCREQREQAIQLQRTVISAKRERDMVSGVTADETRKGSEDR